MAKISTFKPIVGDKKILDFIHSLNGDYKHDREICAKLGMPRSVSDTIRRVFGKIKNKRIIHPKELKDNIIQQYKDGIPLKEISKSSNLSYGSIMSILSLAKVEKNRNPGWSKIQKMRLIDMRENKNMKWSEIAQYFGKSSSRCQSQYTYIKGTQKRQKGKKNEKEKGTN